MSEQNYTPLGARSRAQRFASRGDSSLRPNVATRDDCVRRQPTTNCSHVASIETEVHLFVESIILGHILSNEGLDDGR